MNANTITATAALGCLLAASAGAADSINITSSLNPADMVRAFSAGEIVPIDFWVQTDSDAPLFGVDLEVATATDDLRVVSVLLNPVFTEKVGPDLPIQANASHRAREVRTQDETALNHTLGTDGNDLWLATVEVEVLKGTAFRSALTVRGTAALLGKIPQAINVLGESSRGQTRGLATVPVINTNPPSATRVYDGDTVPWAMYDAPLTLEVRPVGGGSPVTTLEADTTYELHYKAGTSDVSGYALYAITDTPDQGIAVAVPPAKGDWSNTGMFLHEDVRPGPGRSMAAAGFVDGFYKYDVVGDDVLACNLICAPPQGHLCNFTTDKPGTLFLNLVMYQDDAANESVTEMQTEVEFTVNDAGPGLGWQ